MSTQHTAVLAIVELIATITCIGFALLCLACSTAATRWEWLNPECDDDTVSPLDLMARAPAMIIT